MSIRTRILSAADHNVAGRLRTTRLTPYRCGTCRDARPRLTILNSPSPKMSPLARMMMGVSDCLRQLRQYQFINPPIVRAMVKDGVLYMPKLQCR
jgi:hypothetical protein